MRSASPTSGAPSPEPPWVEFARAPLVPVALAATLGLLVDRYLDPSVAIWLGAGFGGIVAWAVAFHRRHASAPLWLCLAAVGLAGWHHRDNRSGFDADDIGTSATDRPAPVRLRAVLDEEPSPLPAFKPNPLQSVPRTESCTTVFAVSEVHTAEGWQAASGRARSTVEGRMAGLHLGDAVEVAGQLVRPPAPANPGEWDARSRMLDRRITAEIRGVKAGHVSRLEEGWKGSISGWLAVVRGWGTRALQRSMPPQEAAVAAALLLGDGSAMDRAEWEAFIRTGVVHVLAISGQHLVVLAGFAWLALRAAGVRRRRGAWFVAALIVGYTLLTGTRPSSVRAAVMVCVVCGGIVLRRPVSAANAFALAWLVVLFLNPADPFTAGCQLSFLSVFVLVWSLSPWLGTGEPDPLQPLIDESRSTATRAFRGAVRVVAGAYAISLVLGAANAPLVLYWQNLVSPVGILVGPPLVFLTSVALLAGFLLLLVSPFGTWVGWPLAFATETSLAACSWLVRLADRLPGGAAYTPSPAVGWVAGFYLLLGGAVLVGSKRRKPLLIGLAAWTVAGLLAGGRRPDADELRVAFLAVGHGGCVVVEAPDGRVLLYDAGTTAGPDVVRRSIAPYLWHRGISRIDEVFLSHADLDHFNGLPELLKRFPVGRVTLTPSFAEKESAGVDEVLAALERHGVERRVAKAGDLFAAGDVTLEVLHPPAVGPAGNENARSLVLLLRHAGHGFLLTGDLEGAGLAMLLARPPPRVDVMLAPHHGSPAANSTDLANWAKPGLVVSSQKPRKTEPLKAAYGPVGAIVYDTATAGAVTVRSHRTGLVADSFRTGERAVIRRGGNANR